MGTTVETLQVELKDTLERIEGIEVLGTGSYGGTIRLKYRVREENVWLKTLMLLLQEQGAYELFIAKKYFLHDDGKMYFVWVMIIESDDIESAVTEVRNHVLQSIGLSQPKRAQQGDPKHSQSIGSVRLPQRSSGWAEKKRSRATGFNGDEGRR